MKVPKTFSPIAKRVLGKNYELSVAFVSPEVSRRLNRTYKGKDKPTNVLSFPLDKKTGEIILCPKKAAEEAKSLGLRQSDYLHYLFIHGLLHLKGFDHGSTMEGKECELCAAFSINGPYHHHRHRHRHGNRQGGRGRTHPRTR